MYPRHPCRARPTWPQSPARRTCLRRLWALAACLAFAGTPSATVLAQDAKALKVGLVPIYSPRTLLTNYQPLRDHLERQLNRPVVMLTATDFRSFHRETVSGAYDLVLTPPHLARLAQTEHKFELLATYQPNNRAVLIMARARPVHTASALRGQRLAVFDPLALVVLHSLHWLEGQGLVAGRDFRVVEAHSHAGVAHMVARGEAVLGVTAPTGIRGWSDDQREQLAVFTTLSPLPSLVWAAHPRLGQEAQRLKSLLLGFADRPEGRETLARLGYTGLREINPDELGVIDPMAREAARLMHAHP